MAFSLKVKEARLFEEKTGKSFVSVAGKLSAAICQTHRLQLGACKLCKKAVGLCPEHLKAFQECEVCKGADVPTDVAAALIWIHRRRADPEASWDEVEEMEYFDMVAELGGQMAGAASTP